MRFATKNDKHESMASSFHPSAAASSTCNAPVLCKTDYHITVPGRMTSHQGVQLGDVDVFRYEGVGIHRWNRQIRHIAVDHIEDYLLVIPLRARVSFSQNGKTTSIGPGQFTLLSTSRPYSVSVDSDGLFSAMRVRLSGAILRQRMPHVERCCGLPMCLRAGVGVIMKHMCELAVFEGIGLSRNEGRQFTSMLIDAVENAMTEAPEVLALLTQEHEAHGAYNRIMREAKSFIELHLSLPELDTDTVALHCRVSKRYLQAVFASSGETVRSSIREMRLLRCRAAISNPVLRNYSIAQIAYHWGFTDLPYFCRCYKTRFNVQPSKDRGLNRNLS